MLVVMTFVSLSVCQVNGAFHQVEFVQARLSPRWRALSAAIFDVLAFGFAALLLWQFIGLELSSWRFGERAPTYPGDAALAAAARDGDRRGGAVLLDRADLARRCEALPHAVAGLRRMSAPNCRS